MPVPLARLVMIDDTDPSIQYSGPWFEVNNTQIETGTNGPPFQNTLHGVNVTANFSFQFSGSEVIVYGTSITTTISGTQNPTWECFIDNTNIGSDAPSLDTNENISGQNNWILCAAQFQDGPHVLTVNANVSNEQTFWFDQIQYAPSASVSLNQSLLRIDPSDSAIQYSPGWEPSNSSAYSYNFTLIDGVENLVQFNWGTETSTVTSWANLTYQFFGTSVSWFGYTKFPSSGAVALANYSVDNQEPKTFVVQSSSNIISDLSNQMLFETGPLSLGQHTLVVTYFGNKATVPIYLDYFVQQDGPSSMSSNTPSPTSISASVPSRSGTNSESSSTASGSTIQMKFTKAIIGGVIIGGLVLLLALFFFLRRLNNRRSQLDDSLAQALSVPFTRAVRPRSPTSTILRLAHKYTSNGQQSLPAQPVTRVISSKFTQPERSQPSDPPSTSNSGGMPPLISLRPPFPSPAFISPSSSRLPGLLTTGLQNNLDGSTTRRTNSSFPQTTTEPSMQRSPSPQGANARFLRHEDSGVRMPPPDEDPDDVIELPPLYTPE